VLDHAGEGLIVLVGFWRFVFSGPYRRRKIAEWRESYGSLGGRLAIASEILAGVVIGVGLPAAIVFWALGFGIGDLGFGI
jgi:hypothetical protein